VTKIEFLYNVDDVTNGIKFVLEKFLKKQNIFIFSNEKKEELSSVLWSESNFFPNIIEAELTTNKQPLEKILIGSKFDPHFDQLLINVSRSECLFFSRFLNLIEIVTDEDNVKNNARNRLNLYREYGFEVSLIDFRELAH
jgi:DNA polymerase IIIc chi subunit